MKGQYEDITANLRRKEYKYGGSLDGKLTLYLHSGEVTHFVNKYYSLHILAVWWGL
jgi:hypothetical protein